MCLGALWPNHTLCSMPDRPAGSFVSLYLALFRPHFTWGTLSRVHPTLRCGSLSVVCFHMETHPNTHILCPLVCVLSCPHYIVLACRSKVWSWVQVSLIARSEVFFSADMEPNSLSFCHVIKETQLYQRITNLLLDRLNRCKQFFFLLATE